MNIRHYYSTPMLQRRELVRGIFSSRTFIPAEISQNTQCSLYSEVTLVPARLSVAVSPGLLEAMSRCFNLLFSLLSMSLKHRLYSSLPQLTVQPNCTISTATQLNTTTSFSSVNSVHLSKLLAERRKGPGGTLPTHSRFPLVSAF